MRYPLIIIRLANLALRARFCHLSNRLWLALVSRTAWVTRSLSDTFLQGRAGRAGEQPLSGPAAGRATADTAGAAGGRGPERPARPAGPARCSLHPQLPSQKGLCDGAQSQRRWSHCRPPRRGTITGLALPWPGGSCHHFPQPEAQSGAADTGRVWEPMPPRQAPAASQPTYLCAAPSSWAQPQPAHYCVALSPPASATSPEVAVTPARATGVPWHMGLATSP